MLHSANRLNLSTIASAQHNKNKHNNVIETVTGMHVTNCIYTLRRTRIRWDKRKKTRIIVSDITHQHAPYTIDGSKLSRKTNSTVWFSMCCIHSNETTLLQHTTIYSETSRSSRPLAGQHNRAWALPSWIILLKHSKIIAYGCPVRSTTLSLKSIYTRAATSVRKHYITRLYTSATDATHLIVL